MKTFDDLQTQDVPQIDTLKFDPDRWKIAEGRKSLSDLQIESAADPVAEQVMKALASTTVPVDFEEAELQSVIEYLSAQTKVNFQLSALAASDIEDTVSYSLSDERSVKTVLDLITDNIEGLSWKIDNGVVLLITDDEKTGGQVNATYSVADLVTPIQDFVAPDINVEPSSGLDPVDEELPERAANVIESGQLEELIQAAVAPNSWDEDPNNSIRVTERGTLVVRQTPEVQREIVQLLDDLRESTGILVDIETQFMRVEDNFLEDIGVDFRGGRGPPASARTASSSTTSATARASSVTSSAARATSARSSTTAQTATTAPGSRTSTTASSARTPSRPPAVSPSSGRSSTTSSCR